MRPNEGSDQFNAADSVELDDDDIHNLIVQLGKQMRMLRLWCSGFNSFQKWAVPIAVSIKFVHQAYVLSCVH